MTELIIEPEHTAEHDDLKLAMMVQDTLEEHYPGWGWMCHINSDPSGGVVRIFNAAITGRVQRPYGFVLHLKNLQVRYAEARKLVVNAGGELLERAGQKRGGYDGGEIHYVEGVKVQHQPFNIIH